jgi:hypothetical protein
MHSAGMVRWYLLLLPLCLLTQDQPKCGEECYDLGAMEAVPVVPPQAVLKDDEVFRRGMVASIASLPSQSFPASLSWAPLQEIGTRGVDFIINYHPTIFLEMCIERYNQEVRGYTAVLIKRERLGGKLQPLEKVDVAFRENPFGVYMNWLEGGSGLIPPKKVLYVKGENNDYLLARARGIGSWRIWEKDIHGSEAKSTGRYTLDQFGINLGTVRSLASMRAAEQGGKLFVSYKGLQRHPKLGDRLCYTYVRTPYEPLEEDGINTLTIYIDRENWLQIGSILVDKDGQLIADYFFNDVKINPQFKKDQFTRAAL